MTEVHRGFSQFRDEYRDSSFRYYFIFLFNAHNSRPSFHLIQVYSHFNSNAVMT
jgi:hypothetical protein